MFDYNALTLTRKHFVDLVIQEFPDITNQITRDQINHVMAKHSVNWPQWLTTPTNKQGKSVWGFPKDSFLAAKIDTTGAPAKEIPQESDEEIATRIRERFDAIDLCVKSATQNKMRSVILSGPPGVGKSFGVTRTLEQSNANFVFASGRSAATGLYKLLYDNRFPNCVIVLDDIDSIFESIDALNILKKACDRSHVRRISWLTETKFTSDEDGAEIPKSFEFEGSIVFVTNIDFDEQINKGSKLSPHFDALISRSFYVNLGIKTKKELIVRIKQVVKEEKMLREEGLTEQEEDKIMNFIEENSSKLRELSLRMCAKLADIFKIDPDNFEKLAKVTCFKG